MIIVFLLIDYYLNYYFSTGFYLCFTTIYIINKLYFKDDLKVFIYTSLYDLFFNNKIFLYTITMYLLYLYIRYLKNYLKNNYKSYIIVLFSSVLISMVIRSFFLLIIDYHLNIIYIFTNLMFEIFIGLLISIFLKIVIKKPFLK